MKKIYAHFVFILPMPFRKMHNKLCFKLEGIKGFSPWSPVKTFGLGLRMNYRLQNILKYFGIFEILLNFKIFEIFKMIEIFKVFEIFEMFEILMLSNTNAMQS